MENSPIMANRWRFRLKDLSILNRNPDKTKTQIMRDSLLSWGTVLKFTNSPEEITEESIPSFIIEGLGISPSELAEMKVGEIWDIEKVE